MASLKPGRHAAGNGSFSRSAGTAAGKAAVLLLIAVGLGVVLLNTADDTPSDQLSNGATTTTELDGEATTTSVPPTTAAPRQPRDVRVASANGTSIAGAAGRVRDVLRAQGFNVLAPGDARATSTSAVYFAPTFDREALTVAQVLGLAPASVKPLPNPPPADPRGANVLVVVGPDLARRPAPTTTTTGRSRSRTTTSTTAAR
jgi:hypothetical protein